MESQRKLLKQLDLLKIAEFLQLQILREARRYDETHEAEFGDVLVIKLDLASKVKALRVLQGKPRLLPGEAQYHSEGCIVIYPKENRLIRETIATCLGDEAGFGDILVIKLDLASKVKELSVHHGKPWLVPEEDQYFSERCVIIYPEVP
ncbi:hypothetical protein AAHA92_26591 [Salvia divinorum]|uniref:Uncharacterized protein n=1 Tax=Salvia divinorum TaxID=28513 RepID=A0ABD1GEE7_SALDI